MSKVVNGFACVGGDGGAANATTHAHSALPASGVAGESRYESQVIIHYHPESLGMGCSHSSNMCFAYSGREGQQCPVTRLCPGPAHLSSRGRRMTTVGWACAAGLTAGSGEILLALASGPWIRSSCMPENPGCQQDKKQSYLVCWDFVARASPGALPNPMVVDPRIHPSTDEGPRTPDPAPSQPK